MVGSKVEIGGPVQWNTGNVQSVGICNQVLRPRCRIVHRHVVDGLLSGFNHVIEGLAFFVVKVYLSCKYVRVTDCESVVVSISTTLVRIGPSNVSSTSQIVGKGWRHSNARLTPTIRPQFIRIPRGYWYSLPRVKGCKAVPSQIRLIKTYIHDFLIR